MNFIFIILSFFSFNLFAQESPYGELSAKEKAELAENNSQVKKEDCKFVFFENESKAHTGLCLKMVETSESTAKPKKQNPYVEELDTGDLDRIIEQYKFLMSQNNEKLKDLQIFFKGLPISYDDLVSSLFQYYLKSFIKLNDTEKVIDSYLSNCTNLTQKEKEDVRMFLILDFKKIQVKVLVI